MMRQKPRSKMSILGAFSLGALLFLVLFSTVHCGNQASQQPMDMAAPMCFTNPMTHVQIINACTDSVAIDKPAALPKFQPGVPQMPLP
jgi:hypothetical protein